MNLRLLVEKMRQMLGDQWGGVECAGPGMSYPSLSSMEEGLTEAATPPLPRRAKASALGNGRKRCLVPNMEGGTVIYSRETLDARKSFYICPPDELRKEVPTPESFLIRTALAHSRQGIMVVPLLSCDSLVMVT